MSLVGQNSDVVIVGGGIIGLTIARSLARRGVEKVTLLERGNLGLEASYAAAGMLAPQAEADARDPFFDLLCQSRDLYPQFAAELHAETGIDVELDTNGTLYLAFTDDDQKEMNARYEWQKAAGLSIERLSSSEALSLEPNIASNVREALRFPLDIQVENRRLMNALANSIAKLGISILSDTNVDSLVIRRGKVEGVETSNGTISCAKVVMAAGAWTNFVDFSGALNAPKVSPVRGQMVCLTAKPQLIRHVIYSPRGYLVPRQDGRLLTGSTSEFAGFAKENTAGGVSAILSRAQEVSPLVATLPIADMWAGLRPRSADGLPVLGPCDEINGLFFATGHYRNGILLAPVTGEVLAQAIVDGKLDAEIEAFSPNRFTSLRTP